MKWGIIIGIVIYATSYVQYAVVRDCGWLAWMNGAEWVWVTGGCK